MNSREVCVWLAVLHVREDGRDGYFQIDRPMGSLTVAKQLHGYLRGEAGMDRPSFAECCEQHLQITAGEFDRLAGIHMEHPEKVTGAFELDFDKREFSAAHPTEGWQVQGEAGGQRDCVGGSPVRQTDCLR